MKKMSKMIMVISLMALLIPMNVSAKEKAVVDFKAQSTLITQQEERMAGQIAIFVSGILVAFLVDGVLIYETGHSGGEWVAAFFEWSDSQWSELASRVDLEERYGEYYVTSFSQADGNECVAAPSGSGYVCKWSV